MRAELLLVLMTCAVASASADMLVPGSTSPDGRVALYYRPIPTEYPSEHPGAFHFRNTKSLSPRSDQLMPTDEADSSSNMLFEDICEDAEAARTGGQRDGAFGYSVAWSPDSRCVAIEGGAHKFWHLMVFRSKGDYFYKVELPDNAAFIGYFHAHLAHLQVDEKGVAKKMRTNHGDYDTPSIAWLDRATLAITTYPYLLGEEDSKLDDGGDSYFMLDCSTRPMSTILGFCR